MTCEFYCYSGELQFSQVNYSYCHILQTSKIKNNTWDVIDSYSDIYKESKKIHSDLSYLEGFQEAINNKMMGPSRLVC